MYAVFFLCWYISLQSVERFPHAAHEPPFKNKSSHTVLPAAFAARYMAQILSSFVEEHRTNTVPSYFFIKA
jgi:hypothetical protein